MFGFYEGILGYKCSPIRTARTEERASNFRQSEMSVHSVSCYGSIKTLGCEKHTS